MSPAERAWLREVAAASAAPAEYASRLAVHPKTVLDLLDALDAAERERDEARAGAVALREALLLHVEWFGGASHHRDDCPGATCEEHRVLAVVEDALADPAGRDELDRRQRAEARVVSLSADAAACATAMGMDGWEHGFNDAAARWEVLKKRAADRQARAEAAERAAADAQAELAALREVEQAARDEGPKGRDCDCALFGSLAALDRLRSGGGR